MNDYKNEALAALPGADERKSLLGGNFYVHERRGLVLFPPNTSTFRDGWRAKYWIARVKADATTPAAALANLRDALTGDDLKRAFPEPAKLEREPYRDADPFGTRRAIAERKPEAPTVPPELVEWQPGEWVWDSFSETWVNDGAFAWTLGGAFRVSHLAVGHTVGRGTTYAEAIDNLRAAALAAAGCATLVAEERPKVTCEVWEASDAPVYFAQLFINGREAASAGGPDDESALRKLQGSSAWRLCVLLGFTPEREQ